MKPMSSYVDENDWIWAASESGGVAFYDGNSWSYLIKRMDYLENNIHQITSDNIGNLLLFSCWNYKIINLKKEKGFVSIDKVSTTKSDYTNSLINHPLKA